MFKKKILSAAAVTALAAGVTWGASTAANAAPLTALFSVTTHITNNAGAGNGGNWATDGVTRTLTVSTDANGADCAASLPAGNVCYSAHVVDHGFFHAIAGAGTPNQFIPGTTILHAVPGTLNGTADYAFYAPSGDVPSAANVLTALDDHGTHLSSGPDSTSGWYLQAFTSTGQGSVHGTGLLNTWAWKYSTGCETWVDSAANGQGNLANDGNITGVICKPVLPTVPFVYAGHVLTGDQHNATVGWLDGIPNSAAAWKMGTEPGGAVNHCVEVFVYGFDRPAGTAHVGFTCDNGNPAANVGYLRGLEPGHTYALFVQPAMGTYGNNEPIPGTNPEAHITVVTPA